MRMSAAQPLLLTALLGLSVSGVTSPSVAQGVTPGMSPAVSCRDLSAEIGLLDALAKNSRTRITSSLTALNENPTSSAVQAQATLNAALYSGDVAYLSTAVQLYLGTCPRTAP